MRLPFRLSAAILSAYSLVFSLTKPCPIAQGKTLHVPGEYLTIQAAIDASVHGDTIRVATGVYPEGINLSGKDVLIESSNANGDPDPENTAIGDVEFSGGESQACILSGFKTGRITCLNSAPTIQGCRISGPPLEPDYTTWPYVSYADFRGAGLYIESSSPTIRDSTVSRNSISADTYDGYHCMYPEAESRGLGAGVYCVGSSVRFTRCDISHNSITMDADAEGESMCPCAAYALASSHGAGVCAFGSTIGLTNCVLSDNCVSAQAGANYSGTANAYANGAAVYAVRSDVVIQNCILAGNHAVANAGSWGNEDEECAGGGLYGDANSSVTLINCTVWNNSASEFSGGVHSDNIESSLLNCILWENSAPTSPQTNSLGLASYSCVEGIVPGAGNIAADPQIAEATGGDFHLLPSSPCIDAGHPGPAHVDGCLPPGLGGLRNDMGAYGGPRNCVWIGLEPPAMTPTPTPTSTITLTPSETPTPSQTGTATVPTTPPPTSTPHPACEVLRYLNMSHIQCPGSETGVFSGDYWDSCRYEGPYLYDWNTEVHINVYSSSLEAEDHFGGSNQVHEGWLTQGIDVFCELDPCSIFLSTCYSCFQALIGRSVVFIWREHTLDAWEANEGDPPPYECLTLFLEAAEAVGFLEAMGAQTVTPTPTLSPTASPSPSLTPGATETPGLPDKDEDGVPDALEARSPQSGGTNLYLPDSDGDGLKDGIEDANRNGAWDQGVETSATNRDTDADGYEDGLETLSAGDPLDAQLPETPFEDADSDALFDPIDPAQADPDSDGDRYLDGYEAHSPGFHAVEDPQVMPTLGDVSGNGVIDNGDSQLILNFFAYMEHPAFSARNSDVNRDAYVDNADAQLLLQYFSRKAPYLPIR